MYDKIFNTSKALYSNTSIYLVIIAFHDFAHYYIHITIWLKKTFKNTESLQPSTNYLETMEQNVIAELGISANVEKATYKWPVIFEVQETGITQLC